MNAHQMELKYSFFDFQKWVCKTCGREVNMTWNVTGKPERVVIVEGDAHASHGGFIVDVEKLGKEKQ